LLDLLIGDFEKFFKRLAFTVDPLPVSPDSASFQVNLKNAFHSNRFTIENGIMFGDENLKPMFIIGQFVFIKFVNWCRSNVRKKSDPRY
jgi:hypothetical protein